MYKQDNNSEFCERLKFFLQISFNNNQRALATAMNISPQTLSPIVLGKSSPGLEVLVRLWSVGCSIDWLISGTGEMYALNPAGQDLKQRWIEHTQKVKFSPAFI